MLHGEVHEVLGGGGHGDQQEDRKGEFGGEERVLDMAENDIHVGLPSYM